MAKRQESQEIVVSWRFPQVVRPHGKLAHYDTTEFLANVGEQVIQSELGLFIVRRWIRYPGDSVNRSKMADPQIGGFPAIFAGRSLKWRAGRLRLHDHRPQWNEKEFDQDIAIRFKAGASGTAAVINPRYVVEGDKRRGFLSLIRLACNRI
jgi:hypothetical protein